MLLVAAPWGCSDDAISASDAGSTSDASSTGNPTATSPTSEPNDSTGATSTVADTTMGGTSSATGDTDATTGTTNATIGTESDTTTDTDTASTGSDPTCDDTQLNGDETDVDCGGSSCDPCADGQECASGTDCASGVCDPATGTCATATCDDLVLNQDETDIDCGGAVCSPCPDGSDCIMDVDCQSDICDGALCIGATCIDGVLNGGETDIDCGGPACSPCGPGDDCLAPGDCDSGICMGNVCIAATCADGVLNQDETDIDCGGSTCAGCPDGGTCMVGGDCLGTSCDAGICASCSDGVLDQDETDIDCGGSTCAGCPDGGTCMVGGDCLGTSCDAGICASCSDGVLDQDETDLDCGGSTCAGCPDGGMCIGDLDCASTSCEAGTCVSCSDGVLNQDETDIDCGGSTCAGCPGQCGYTVASTDWNLPVPMHGYDSDVALPKPFESVVTHSDDCGVVGQTYRYDVLDISGDGIVDLVVTDDTCVSNDIARTHWRVFLGTPTGFSDVPINWNLPAPMHGYDSDVAFPKPFESVLTHSDDCGVVGQTYRYDVFDISGDGIVDMVLTDDTCVSNDIARTHWRVFLGTPAGFSDVPTNWNLPLPMQGYDSDVAFPKPFESVLTHSDDCGVVGQTYRYDVFDISGDGIVDLVLTDDTCVSNDIARTHWRVFLGTPTGFSDLPTDWNLPLPMQGYDSDVAFPKPFESVSTHSDDCGVVGQTYRYDVLDISGDDLVDLVLTDDTCISGDIARTHWRVFQGTPAGFSDLPINWNLPLPMQGYDSDVALPKPFESVSTHSDDCGVVGQTYRYDVLDVSGDGLLDLVLTDDTCVSNDIARTHWRVFQGTPTGFSDLPTTWDLPLPMQGYDSDVALPKPFESVLTHSDDCGVVGQTYRYDVLDISGDGLADIVLTDDTCVSDDIARTHWLVYTGAACAP